MVNSYRVTKTEVPDDQKRGGYMSATVRIRPPGITCTDWKHCKSETNRRRCSHITREHPTETLHLDTSGAIELPDGTLWRGQCALPTRLMCEEWLKTRPEDRIDRYVRSDDTAIEQKGTEDEPSTEQATPVAKSTGKSRIAPPGASVHVSPDFVPTSEWPLPEETVQAFRQEGVEVELQGQDDFHVVPERTGADRLEMTFDEFSLVRAVMEVFPGTKLLSFKKADPNRREEKKRKVFELVVTDELRERCKRLDPRTGIPKEWVGK